VFAPDGGHNGFTWRYLIEPLLEWITPRVAAAGEAHPAAHANLGQPGDGACPTCVEGHGAVSASRP
jgi:hypothetical protein